MPTATLEKPETLPRANVRGRNPFPNDQYVTIPNIPIFCEHETTGPDGEKQVFDRAKLEHLAANGNKRIQLTGDYSAICIGHTHDPEDGELGDQPEVIGGMGPFRLGQLGEQGQPTKYCILADLHIRRDKIDLYNACPRRSVELWYKFDEPQFIDPLSLLSETPRLDLGLAPLIDAKGGDGFALQKYALRYLYSAKFGDGMTVVKYAAAAPAFSGSSNVLTPSQNYSAKQRSTKMLEPEEVQQIVDAVSQLDTFVAMEQVAPLIPKLQEIIAKNDQANQSLNETPGDIVPKAENPAEHESLESPSKEAAEEAAVAPEAKPAAAPPAEEPAAEPEKYSLDENSTDDQVERYMAWRKEKAAKACYSANQAVEDGGAPAHAPAAKNEDTEIKVTKDKYSKMQEQINELLAEKVQRIDEDRARRLTELRQLRVFDVEKEMERTRYSKMNDEGAFNERIADISENYRPTGVTTEMPVPEELLHGKTVAAPGMKKDRYSKETVDKAIRYCTAQASLGKDTDYAAVLENIDRGLSPDHSKV